MLVRAQLFPRLPHHSVCAVAGMNDPYPKFSALFSSGKRHQDCTLPGGGRWLVAPSAVAAADDEQRVQAERQGLACSKFWAANPLVLQTLTLFHFL